MRDEFVYQFYFFTPFLDIKSVCVCVFVCVCVCVIICVQTCCQCFYLHVLTCSLHRHTSLYIVQRHACRFVNIPILGIGYLFLIYICFLLTLLFTLLFSSSPSTTTSSPVVTDFIRHVFYYDYVHCCAISILVTEHSLSQALFIMIFK